MVPKTVPSNLAELDNSDEEQSDSHSGSTTTTPVNSQEQLPSMGLKKLKHSDPLDDSIFSKLIGEGVLYTLYKYIAHYIPFHKGVVD